MSKLQEIFEKCQSACSWGNKINSVDDRNSFEDTVLHTVCGWGDLQAAKVLVEAGADVNAKGDQGATPLFSAIRSGNLDLIEFLLKHGASKESKIYGTTSVYDYVKNRVASSQKNRVANSQILKLLK